MEITLRDAGKRFGAEWIFRNVNHTFAEGSTTAILGRNGSGKSTLLQIVGGNLLPTAGSVNYRLNGKDIVPDKAFRHLTLCAPYQEIIEDFNLEEMLKFHFAFKEILPGFDHKKLTEMLGFKVIRHKPLRSFSSGMKQRVKLVLAIMSNVPLVLLDEPTMNLDKAGTEWYIELIRSHAGNRTIIVCSNLEETETGFCRERLRIEDYK